MSFPTYKSAGAGTNTASPVWGTHATDDIGILLVNSSNQAVAETSGFTEAPGSPIGVGTPATAGANRLTCFWKRAASGAEPNAAITSGLDHTHSKIAVFSGCKKTGTPIHAYSFGSDATLDTILTAIGPTTTNPYCLVVIMATTGLDSAAANWSGEAAANLNGLVERYDSGITTGFGGGIALWTGNLATPGPVGTFTANSAGSTSDAWLVLVLEPHVPPIVTPPANTTPLRRASPGAGGALTPMRAGPTGIVLCGSDLGGGYISYDNCLSWICCGSLRGLLTPHVRAVGFDQSDEKIMYFPSEHGIYRTSDTGTTWALVSADFYCTAVETTPADVQIAYAVGHPLFNSDVSSVYKSTNRGVTWSVVTHDLPLGLRINKLLVDPTDTTKLEIVSANDLFKGAFNVVSTTNGTNTVTSAALFGSVQQGMSISGAGIPAGTTVTNKASSSSITISNPATDSTTGARTFELNFSIWRSTNSGANWTEKGAGKDWWDLAMDINNPATTYGTIKIGALPSSYTGETWKSTDSLATLTRSPVTDPSHTGSVLVARDDGDIWIIDTGRDPGHAEEGLFESNDGGASYTRVSVLTDYEIGYVLSAQWAFGKNLYSTAVALGQSMFDADTIFMTNAQYCYRSINRGRTFEQVFTNHVSPFNYLTRGLECLTVQTCAISQVNRSVIYIGMYDLGLWRSLDGGRGFQTCNTAAFTGAWNGNGGSAMSILPDPTRPGVVWATMGETALLATVVKSTDFGEATSWTSADSGLPANVFKFGLSLDRTSPSTSRTLFSTAGTAGDVYKSTNDGASWSLVLAGSTSGGCRYTAVDEFNGNLVYAGGEGGLWRSTNGGTSWAQVGGATFVGSLGGTVLSSFQWTGVHQIVPSPIDTGTVFLTVFGVGKGLYRSTDSGVNWTKLHNGDYVRGVAVHPTDPLMLLCTSSKPYKAGGTILTSEGLLRSVDGGTTWIDFNQNLPWRLAGPVVYDRLSPDKYMVGSPGNGFWIYDPSVEQTEYTLKDSMAISEGHAKLFAVVTVADSAMGDPRFNWSDA